MNRKRILVCGPRDWTHRPSVENPLDALAHNAACIISGCASGVDTMALDWALNNNIPIEAYPANWVGHGLAAGQIRNKRMLEEGKPDEVWAWHYLKSTEPIYMTPGTKHMVVLSLKAGIKIRYFTVERD